MSVLDFLFEGRPPQSTTTYGQSVENLPKWMSDYTQGLVARANAIAAEPYQQYGGPRIAGFDPAQERAFSEVEQNVGGYRPGLEQAAGAMGQGAGYLQQGARAFTDPGVAESYMNPYIENVLNRQQTLSQRNLEENFLPSLQDTFTRAGHFGSDRMMDLGVRGTRDIAEGLQEQQLGALSQAYGQAGTQFGQDQSRMLQAGQGLGNLGTQIGGLEEARQGLGARDAASLEAVGAQRRGLGQGSLDLAYDDFQRQQQYPRETTDWMSSVIRGLPSPTATQSTAVGPANAYGPSPVSQIGSLATGIYGLSQMGKKLGGLAKVTGYRRKEKSPQYRLEYSYA